MTKKYVVELAEEERDCLEGIVKKGKALARKRQHAQILLMADQGGWGQEFPRKSRALLRNLWVDRWVFRGMGGISEMARWRSEWHPAAAKANET